MKQLHLTDDLYHYLLDVSLREHPVLQELRQETAKLSLGGMQITPVQGQFIQMLLHILNAKQVLEIGTFTGYSALAMALALPEDGRVMTCDINTEWTNKALPYWRKAQQQDKIQLKLGPALQTLQTLLDEGFAQSFDFIFIDADKTNYLNYYELAIQLISAHGLIAIDNVFWGGKVIDPQETGAQVREIRKLNQCLKQDQRVIISLVPMGDGLFLVRRK